MRTLEEARKLKNVFLKPHTKEYNMKVREIMSKDCKVIDPNTTFQEAAKIMRDKDVGCLPVGEHDRLVGIITDRDLVVRSLANAKEVQTGKVKDAMTPKCLYCFEEDTIEEVSENMAQNQVRRLPVLNSSKRLVGIISLGDLCCKGSKETASEALQAISHKKN
jgi:CBS domain-containing protein